MATTLQAEAGSASTFDFTMFDAVVSSGTGSVTSDTQAVFGSTRSINCTTTTTNGWQGVRTMFGPAGFLTDAGSRIHISFRFTALPAVTIEIMEVQQFTFSNPCVGLAIDSTGHLVIVNTSRATAATGTTVLSINTDYDVTFAYSITNASVNQTTVYLNGVSEVSATNISSRVGSHVYSIGWNVGEVAAHGGASQSIYFAHEYADNGANADLGQIRCTAKRPFANGTTNGFSTTGSGSGYGTGNAQFVNERALSTANFASVIGAGSAITEEYNIEGSAVGDISLATATLVDYMGWLYAKSLAGETGQLILNNVTGGISLTSTNTMFTRAAGSTTYPAGTGTDIGIITDTSLTTVSLFEAGIIFVYIPGASGGTVFIMNAGTQRRPYQMASTTGGDPIMRGQA